MTKKGWGKMKKNFKMLAKGISLVLMLSLVLSTTVFAATATYEPTTASVVEDASEAYYKENSTYTAQFIWTNKSYANVYNYSQGGVWVTLPFAENPLTGIASNAIKKAELTITIRNNAGTAWAGNSNSRLLLLNVPASEYNAYNTAVEGGATNLFYENGAAVSHAPQALKNYITDTAVTSSGVGGTFYTDQYKNGYMNVSLQNGNGEAVAEDNGRSSKFTYDVTDLIKDGSLTEDRYLLIQRGLKDGTNGVGNSTTFFVPTTYYPPTLTIEYLGAGEQETTPATGITSHKSLNDEGTEVNFSTTYGYTVTFNGAVDGTTLNNNTVIIKDSNGEPVNSENGFVLKDIAYDEDTQTATISLPVDTSETQDDGKWLTAGETYTITFTDGVKQPDGTTSVFPEGNSDVTFTMKNKEYDFEQSTLRTGKTFSTAVTTLSVGGTGTKAGDTLYAFSRMYNYTNKGAERLGLIAVYDENGVLVQCGVKINPVYANQMSGVCNPGMTLNQDLQAGWVVKSYVWNRVSMKPYVHESADLNDGTNRKAMTMIVVGP